MRERFVRIFGIPVLLLATSLGSTLAADSLSVLLLQIRLMPGRSTNGEWDVQSPASDQPLTLAACHA